MRRKGQTLVGFPALTDAGDAVTIEVFDEPEVAAARHRAGLRRLFALQIKDALKYLEKNVPDLQKMAVATCRWERPRSCASKSSTSRWTAPSCSIRAARRTKPTSPAAWTKAARAWPADRQ